MQQGRSEEDAARVQQCLEVLEDNTFGPDAAGQAVQQVVHSDGIERWCRQRNRLENVGAVDLWVVSSETTASDRETVRIEVHQRESRRGRRESTAVEEIPGPDTDVEMVRRDVLLVVLEDPTSRALPSDTGEE